MTPEDKALCERLRAEFVIAEHQHPAFTIVLPSGEVQECGPSKSQDVQIRNPDGKESRRPHRAAIRRTSRSRDRLAQTVELRKFDVGKGFPK